jgi:hypothetical protein
MMVCYLAEVSYRSGERRALAVARVSSFRACAVDLQDVTMAEAHRSGNDVLQPSHVWAASEPVHWPCIL